MSSQSKGGIIVRSGHDIWGHQGDHLDLLSAICVLDVKADGGAVITVPGPFPSEAGAVPRLATSGRLAQRPANFRPGGLRRQPVGKGATKRAEAIAEVVTRANVQERRDNPPTH